LFRAAVEINETVFRSTVTSIPTRIYVVRISNMTLPGVPKALFSEDELIRAKIYRRQAPKSHPTNASSC
jgi:hypothetical protein